ncbi:MAG: hypothetical protein MJE63_08450 [Proteobacteria bacterium]|nr:hypothetical protein [Pseudomonadota bacterium]
MVNLLHYITIGISICFVTALGLTKASMFTWSWIVAVSTGALLILLAGSAIIFETAARRPWISRLMLFVSACLVPLAWFIDGTARWYTLIAGLIISINLLMVLRLKPVAQSFLLHSSDGATLMEIKNLDVRGYDIVLRGKMMGTMPTSAHMKPEEMWAALTMMPIGLILRLPVLLVKAFGSARKISNRTGGQSQNPFERVRRRSVQPLD